MANVQSISSLNFPDRVMPNNEDAERIVLGTILLDYRVLDEIVDLLDENSFYHTGHSIIYRSILELYEKNRAVDLITLTEELSRQGKLDMVGGGFYLSTLLENVVTTSNISYHANIIKDKYIARRLIQAAYQIAERCYNSRDEIDFIVDDAERLIFEIAQRKEKRDIRPLSELLPEGMEHIENVYNKQGGITGLPSGYKKMDMMTGGFQKSDLIIIAARPGMGKTSLALNIASFIATQMARKEAEPVLIFSLEMSKEQILQRILCTEAGVPSDRIRKGFLSQKNWQELTDAAAKLSHSEIYLDDTPGISVLELRAKARRFKARVQNLSLIVVDYLQLMTGRQRAENRQQEISEISRSLKALARELKIPIVALSQLNRQVEQRGRDYRPQLSDLRESGAIEQDADVVIFIAKPPQEGDTPSVETDNLTKIIIAKQRNGPTGEFDLVFIGQYTRFAEPFYTRQSPAPTDEEDEGESFEA